MREHSKLSGMHYRLDCMLVSTASEAGIVMESGLVYAFLTASTRCSIIGGVHQPSMIGPQIAKAHPAGMK